MFSWPTVALKLDSKYVAYIVETFSLISDTIKQTKVTINDTEHIKLKKMFMLRRYTTFKIKLEHSMSVKNIAPRPTWDNITKLRETLYTSHVVRRSVPYLTSHQNRRRKVFNRGA